MQKNISAAHQTAYAAPARSPGPEAETMVSIAIVPTDFLQPVAQECCSCSGEGFDRMFKEYAVLLLCNVATSALFVYGVVHATSPVEVWLKLIFVYSALIMQNYPLVYAANSGGCDQAFDMMCPYCGMICMGGNSGFCLVCGCRCGPVHYLRYLWASTRLGLLLGLLDIGEAIVGGIFIRQSNMIGIGNVLLAVVKMCYKGHSYHTVKNKRLPKEALELHVINIPATATVMPMLAEQKLRTIKESTKQGETQHATATAGITNGGEGTTHHAGQQTMIKVVENGNGERRQ